MRLQDYATLGRMIAYGIADQRYAQACLCPGSIVEDLTDNIEDTVAIGWDQERRSVY